MLHRTHPNRHTAPCQRNQQRPSSRHFVKLLSGKVRPLTDLTDGSDVFECKSCNVSVLKVPALGLNPLTKRIVGLIKGRHSVAVSAFPLLEFDHIPCGAIK